MFSRISTSLTHRAARAFGGKYRTLGFRRPVVSISFDDFPVSAWEVGGRILRQHGVRGSYYVAGNLCGTEFDGNAIVEASRLTEVAAAGHEIGCHTFNHRRLRCLPAPDIVAEFDANLAFLKSVLPKEEVTTFAYPYGDVSVAAKRTAASRFAACRGVFEGVNVGKVDVGLLSCVCLEPHVLSQRSVAEWIQDAVRLNGWVIFLTHDVSETHGPYGTTPRLLEEVVTTAIASGCDVLPVREALDLASSPATA
ncbi:polysaccharide deacetylase family protein [Ostreiculturibacter nitratireducens]|uniref:polysaccharide deacetylase family protein n=1 Tax=Ostreiculturibacter nitratireducens TaxID=3075226 RepID=UPI0031B62702